MKPNIIVARAAAAAAIVALSGTAACGSGTGGAGESAKAASAAASARPAGNGIAAKSETEIVNAAREALAHARSVHVHGVIAENGGRITMDLRVAPHACDGRVTSPMGGTNVRVELRCTGGRTYMRSRELVRAKGGAVMARLVGDRWFYSSKRGSEDPLGGRTTPAAFAKILTSDGQISRGGTATVNGVPALKLLDSGAALFVATAGTPYPLRVEPDPPEDGQVLDLLDYDAPFAVAAPPGAIDIDHVAR